MFQNLLKTAFRSVVRQGNFAIINVSGLSIGLLCTFFIAVWIADELSFDRFHNSGGSIHQVWRHMTTEGQINTYPSHGQPVADALLAEYPEVESITFVKLSELFVVSQGDNTFREVGGYASPLFFEVFSFPFALGDGRTALTDVNSVVISERVARRFFGENWRADNNLLGQSIKIDHRKEFTVTGVVKDVPANSSLQFDILLPARDFTDRLNIAQAWYYMAFSVYTRLQAGTSLPDLNAKIADLFIRHGEGEGTKLFMQPFEDVHLHSTYKDGHLAGGRIDYIKIFAGLAAFLLLIACINFMNLATARSARRAREIGVRKVVGAQRRALIFQFMSESVVLALVSFILALGAAFPLLPLFNELTAKDITVSDFSGGLLAAMAGIAILVGLIAGSYPALYLSAFNPALALRALFKHSAGNLFLRKGLVVFQFAISVLMIVVTIGVFLQLRHMRNVDLGLNRSGLVFVPREAKLADKYDVVAQELVARPGIASVTASGQNPLSIGNNTTSVAWPGKTAGVDFIFFIVNASYDYAKTMGIKLAAGRDFSAGYNEDNHVLLNEEAAGMMGGDVIGKKILVYGDEVVVVGVVKDFSMNSLYSPVEPVIIRFDPKRCGRVYVSFKPGETADGLASLQLVCEQVNPGYPFEYTFLDQVFEQTYRSEAVMGRLANIFAVIAVFISCLGLLGLTAFAIEQRTKEVGIRKVLGASVASIAALLSSEFVKLVLIGVALALPVAAYVLTQWLQGFSSRINIEWWIFLLAGIAPVLFAIVTISYQSIKAATINPVETLKSE